jgi:hypothetical protein
MELTEALEKLKAVAKRELGNLEQLESNPPQNTGVWNILTAIELMLGGQPVWPADGNLE